MPDPTPTPTPEKTAAVKCPGWHHEYSPTDCDVDRKVHAWVSARQETTLGDREKRRVEQHHRAGIFGPDVEE